MRHTELDNLVRDAVEAHKFEYYQGKARNGHEGDKDPFFIKHNSQLSDEHGQDNAHNGACQIHNSRICLSCAHHHDGIVNNAGIAGVECKIEEEGGHNHQNVRLIRQHLAQTFENGLILALGRIFDFPSPGGAPCDKDGSTCYGAQCEGC